MTMSKLVGPAYQYIKQGSLPTYKFQRSLPRLKIPNLDKTHQRYCTSLEPVFENDKGLATTKQLADNFFKTQGKDLQQRLISFDKTVQHTSYINGFWFDSYLSARVPLPLSYNPFLAWRMAPTAILNDQVIKASNLVISAIRFKNSLEANLLEPEVFYMDPKNTPTSQFYKTAMMLSPEAIATYVSFAFKAFPLDMSQYKNLFNSTRIPLLKKDEIVKYDASSNRHIVVIKGGQFYSFDVIDSNGDLLSPEVIYTNINHIANQPSPITKSICEFTTANRDFWAKEREYLINISEKNNRNISKIDSAIFVLCLDDCEFDSEQLIEGAHNFLHGCNGEKSTNRWFDKSFSLVVTKQGHSCINFEHSWGDGVAILRFFNDTFADISTNPQITERLGDASLSPLLNVQKLDFDLDQRLKDGIDKSHANHKRITSNLDIGTIKYSKLDRSYFKKNKLSPDSMSQLAFQLAFKRAYNCTPVSYESCSTAAFRGGRTETVRPCTAETNKACEAILSSQQPSKSELKHLLSKCSATHYQLCKEASMGNGFDRHLFALKEIGLRDNVNLHNFFTDPLHTENQKFVLSTSTLYGECFEGGGFAPTTDNGFGLGYGYVDSIFGVLATSYKNHRNNTQFVQALQDSLDDITKIVET